MRSSDHEAFRLLFERYQPIIFRQAFLEVRDADLAHDVVQQTFLRVWDRRASLKAEQSILAFMVRISRNLVRDLRRHSAVRAKLARDVPLPALSERDDPAESLQLDMVQEKILSVINEDLPERCRVIFLLSRFEGKDHSEIAELLGVSMKTVANQINRALSILRKRLRGYTSPGATY